MGLALSRFHVYPIWYRNVSPVGFDGVDFWNRLSSVYVDVPLYCSTPAPASNRVNLLHGSHRCTHTPSRHQILQAARAWLRNNSAITAKVDISCARADACSTDDCTPLAASVIACAARLRQNRCNETHQNKSAPRGGASERSNNRASAPRGGGVAFRTNQ